MPLFAPPKLTETYTTTFFLPSSITQPYVSPISNLLLSDGNGGTYFTTFPTDLTVSTLRSLSTITDYLTVSTLRSLSTITDYLSVSTLYSLSTIAKTVSLTDNNIAYNLYVQGNALYFDGATVLTSNRSLSYINTLVQNIPPSVYTAVEWNTKDMHQAYGVTNVSSVGTSFSNYSTSILSLSVTGYIGWDTGGTAGSSRSVYAFLNGTVGNMNSCLSYSSIPTPLGGAGEMNPVVNFSFNTILNPSEYFDIYVSHNDSTAQEINTQVAFPGSRITLFIK